jgi:hypothetical protein
VPQLTADDLQSERDAIADTLPGRCQIVRRALNVQTGARQGPYTDIRATGVPCQVDTPWQRFLDFSPYINNPAGDVETKEHRLITLAYGPVDPVTGHVSTTPYDVADGDRVVMLIAGVPDANYVYELIDVSSDETNPVLFNAKANRAKVTG